MICISTILLRQMQDHAQAQYPLECCGLMLGLPAGQSTDGPRAAKQVTQICPAINAWEQAQAAGEGVDLHKTPRERYWIDPAFIIATQKQARDRQWSILGVYHSHPQGPAQPSECDRQWAWSDYSYVIMGMDHGQVQDCQSWVLDDQHQFQPEPVQILRP
ncbi:M67 family metallopeptidase [Lyngbya confervoides]|uniref:M67 family metallopeptidase n=1 Tax=Lyngbya confervoides BDU141951 TaxID=1574623 RepID=A0ABD4T3Y3_9CYAN|nr:M67 family metallopeptidase [Lyngbya confervoides]MCM1982947.1 M67 family metallopeptidase [Lyngbya confervoides BDU141951]